MTPKYASVEVKLRNPEKKNVFLVLVQVQDAMKAAGVSAEECTAYVKQAFSEDFDSVVAASKAWVTISA